MKRGCKVNRCSGELVMSHYSSRHYYSFFTCVFCFSRLQTFLSKKFSREKFQIVFQGNYPSEYFVPQQKNSEENCTAKHKFHGDHFQLFKSKGCSGIIIFIHLYILVDLYYCVFSDKNSAPIFEISKISIPFDYNFFQIHILVSYWLTIINAYLVNSINFNFTAAFFAKSVRSTKFHQFTINVLALFHQCTSNVFEFVFYIYVTSMFHHCTIDVSKLNLHPCPSMCPQCTIHMFEFA